MDQSLFVDTPHPTANPDLFVDTPPPPSNDLGGMAESFGRGALNNFPMAKQAAAAILPGGYSPNLAELSQKAGTAKAANPISYGAGAVTGAAAPMMIPGAGTLAGLAAQGAAGAISDTDLLKQPGEAVKQGLVGGVLGAGIGKAGEMLTEGAPAALEAYANKKGVQALNLRPGVLGVSDEELTNLGKFAHENGLLEGDTQTRATKAKQLLQQKGQEIQAIGGGAQPLRDAAPFVNKLQQDAEQAAKVYGKEANAEIPIYRQGIANLQQNGTTFDQLQTLKNAYGKRAFSKDGEVTNQAAADVYGQIKDAMKSIIQTSPKEYQEAMTDYGNLLDMHHGLYNQLQKEQASGIQAKGFGMAGKMAGMLGQNPLVNVGLATAMAPVHPFMAAGALTPILMNPQAMQATARGIGAGIPKATQGISQELIDYLTSKYGNKPQ